MTRRAVLVVCLLATVLAALSAGNAGAADECKGLNVCLPVTGPWVVVPAGGVDYEIACPLRGYVVAGTDARVADPDVDVSFRGEPGSPVGPGVTTRRSVVFHASRTRSGAGTTSFQPFIGCIPTNGEGGRALTGVATPTAGRKPAQTQFSVVVNAPVRGRSRTVRASCPTARQFLGSTYAITFRQPLPASAAQRAAVGVRRSVVGGVVVARVTATPAAGSHVEVQLRVVCARAR